MSSIVHNHSTLDRLLTQRRNTRLTDYEIIFEGRTFPCHKAVAVLTSKTIASSVVSHDNTLIFDEDLDVTAEVIETVVDSLYGSNFEISKDNAIEVLDFARFMGMSSLQKLSKSAIKNYEDKSYTPSLEAVLSDLENDQFRDFSLVYKNVRIKLHKFLLTTLCPVFLSRFALQPGDNEWNFTDLLTIQESSFEEFFTSFYKDNIIITLENLFDISHLASYFKMSSLVSCCDSLMNSAEPLVGWIFPALESADKADDLRFVHRLASVLVKVDDLAQSHPVAIKPDVLFKLCPNVNVFWLTTVLVHSYFHYESNNNQRVWTPNEVEKALTQIDTNTLTINQLFSVIQPLLKVEELYSVLSEFSLTRFTIEKSEIPSEWLVWLMVELDKNEPTNELNLTTRFASLLSKVFSKAKLSLIEPLVLHPKSFTIYLSNITQQYLILWFVRSLIISWKVENHWTVEIFDEILSIVNLENVDSRELIAVLRPLENISELFDFFCKFMSTKVIPLVIRDYAKTSEELSTSKQELATKCHEFQTIERNLKAENETLKKSNENFQKNLQQEKVNVNNLQSENSKLKLIVDKHAEIIRRAEEEEAREIKLKQEREAKEAEQKRLTELAKQQAFEAQLNQEFINKGGVKFLASNKGSRLTLSENDLLVTRTVGCGWTFMWDNSFVQINHPVKGKVVLTLKNSGIGFNTRIGLFDPSHCQASNSYDYAHALFVDRGNTQFQVNNSFTGPSNPGGISEGQQIVIDFNNDQVTFSVPSLGYSHRVTWPSGYVFGLAMLVEGTSWQVSSS
ncbi:hypothetical protein RCL1_003399 [Eukaryota sp. TZLM3-RCL]